MQFAEDREHELGPELNRSRATGMQILRPARDDLHLVDGHAAGGERRQRIGLGVEHIDGAGGARPVAAGAGSFGGAAADGGGGDQLILRPVAREYLADLEEGDIGIAAIGVSLRGERETRQQARAHVG